jgi:hypothetical protein
MRQGIGVFTPHFLKGTKIKKEKSKRLYVLRTAGINKENHNEERQI